MGKVIKQRVLLITPFCPPGIGGAETHLQDLYEYLRTHDYFVYVCTYQPITVNIKGKPIERRKNLEIHRYSWIGHNFFLKLEKYHPLFNFIYLTPYLFVRTFFFVLKHRNKIDVINAHGLNAAFIAVIIKKMFGIRSTMSTMALYCFKPNTLFAKVSKWVLGSLDRIIAETQESKDEIISIGVPAEKIVVFSHWVDQNKFKPSDKNLAKRKFGWEDKFIVLFVGRAIPIKGGDTLVEVVSKINKKINLAIISDAGPLIDLFKKTADKNKNFLFVGGVPYEDLHNYYKAADVFIIPSRYEEGAARVMMEAVSCGIPVVASNKGAIPSVLSNEVAVFVDPTAEKIREALENLYNNEAKIDNLRKKTRQFARERFGFKNVKVILDAYKN